jgi:uncharacterized phosphosugar-binding protein
VHFDRGQTPQWSERPASDQKATRISAVGTRIRAAFSGSDSNWLGFWDCPAPAKGVQQQKMSAYDQFVSVARNQFDRVADTQRSPITTAGNWLADSLAGNGFLYAFGTGHSHMVAEEIFYRAGHLARAVPILEETLMMHLNAIEATYLEREQGRAKAILDQYPVKAGDLLVVASNGGRNAVPIEMVLEGKARGLKTVAITNMDQTRRWPSRHPSGKRLADVADLVIDNCGVDGDAAMGVEGFPHRIGPPSTITGILIINLIVVHAIEQLVKRGVEPEIYISSNTQGDDHNDRLLKKYKSQIRHL